MSETPEVKIDEIIEDAVKTVTAVDEIVEKVMDLTEKVKILEDEKTIVDVIEDNVLEEEDFDVNKDGILDSNELNLMKTYQKSTKEVMDFAQKTVAKNSRNALISNIIFGVVFLVQLILNLV